RKQNFILGIILPAETRVILVSAKIKTTHGFEETYRRCVLRQGSRTLTPEEAPRRKCSQRVVGERSRRQKQHRLAPRCENGIHAVRQANAGRFSGMFAFRATLAACLARANPS